MADLTLPHNWNSGRRLRRGSLRRLLPSLFVASHLMSWVYLWMWGPEDAMWVPSLLVMSGRTQGKGAKATSTDSPPKG